MFAKILPEIHRIFVNFTIFGLPDRQALPKIAINNVK